MTDRRVNQETANFRYNVYLIYDQKLTDKPQFYFSSYAYFHINILAPFKMQIFKQMDIFCLILLYSPHPNVAVKLFDL